MEKIRDMKKALFYAIHAEMEANEFYRTWADESDTPHIKKELHELAQWEAGHRDALCAHYEKTFSSNRPSGSRPTNSATATPSCVSPRRPTSRR